MIQKAKRKMQFSKIDEITNELLSLRDKKQELLQQLRPINERIEQIERDLVQTYTEPKFEGIIKSGFVCDSSRLRRNK